MIKKERIIEELRKFGKGLGVTEMYGDVDREKGEIIIKIPELQEQIEEYEEDIHEMCGDWEEEEEDYDEEDWEEMEEEYDWEEEEEDEYIEIDKNELAAALAKKLLEGLKGDE